MPFGCDIMLLMRNRKLKVILTCGGRRTGALAGRAPGGVKALLDIGGRTLLEAAVDAASGLAACGGGNSVMAICAVGPDDVWTAAARLSSQAAGAGESSGVLAPAGIPVLHAKEGETVLDNIKNGMERLSEQPGDEFLVISPDLPFLNAKAIDEFLVGTPDDAGLALPVVIKEHFQAGFPGADNKFNKMLEGELTIGSVFYVKGGVVEKNTGIFMDAHNARKNPGKIAGMLGLSLSLKFLAGKLSLKEAQNRIGTLLDCAVYGVLPASPLLALDIDDERDLAYAEKLLSG